MKIPPTNLKITSLPEDKYGVHVDGDMDERRLLWLANEVGEHKLRLAIEGIKKKYPDTQPFVSKLLKRFGRKVPVSVYSEVSVPIYRVYLLISKEHTKLKIGFSGDWVSRACNLLHEPGRVVEIFDVDKSFSVLIGSNQHEARNFEKKILDHFRAKSGYQTTQPDHIIPFGAGGKHEWFHGFAFSEMETHLLFDDNGGRRSSMTLREAINYNFCLNNIFGSPY